jgi:hypothetical protein
MKVGPIKRFIISRRKKKIWLWHRTEAKNIPEIKKSGLKPHFSKGFAAGGPNVKIINSLFDEMRPKGLRLSRANSVFLDLPDVYKRNRAFWSAWLEPGQKEELLSRYTRIRANPKKFFVGDMNIVTTAQDVLESQAKKSGRQIASQGDISPENKAELRRLGKQYWNGLVTLEEFLKNYEWATAPIAAYQPRTGKGLIIKNPEVMAPEGKTIKGAKVSKGKI